MPSTDPLLFERTDDGVVTLTFQRPAVHNALDWAAMDAFAAAVSRLADGGVSAVIVTGAGTESFCSGGDQRALVGHTAREDGERLARTMGDALGALERLPVPVLAAVNGIALGGGAEVALACDLRFVDAAVRFGLVHLRLGLIPGWGGGQRLARLVGPGRAARMLLEARPYGAEELESLGLADDVAPAGQALPAARAFAARVAQADPATVASVKRLLWAARHERYPDALRTERALFEDLWPAQAHVAAMQAFGRA